MSSITLPENGASGFDSLSRVRERAGGIGAGASVVLFPLPRAGEGRGEGERDVIFTCIAKSLVLLASWPRMPVDEISMRLWP